MCAFRTYDKLVFFLEWREEQNSVCAFHGLQTSLVQEDKTQKFRNGGWGFTIEELESGIYWMCAQKCDKGAVLGDGGVKFWFGKSQEKGKLVVFGVVIGYDVHVSENL